MRDTLAGGAMACSARGAGEPACQEERAEVAAEPRTLVAVLELRLGARLGCGTGERERERALRRLTSRLLHARKPLQPRGWTGSEEA